MRRPLSCFDAGLKVRRLNGLSLLFHCIKLGKLCADIAQSNLSLIERVTRLKGIRASFHLIRDDLSFDGLAPFDAVFACGSLHHVPMLLSRRECGNILPLLKRGGRWIELTYTKERWAREGSLPKPFVVVGVSRAEQSDEDFRRWLFEAAESYSRSQPIDPRVW